MQIPDSGFKKTIQEIKESREPLHSKEKKESFLVDADAVKDAFRQMGRILLLAIDSGGAN